MSRRLAYRCFESIGGISYSTKSVVVAGEAKCLIIIILAKGFRNLFRAPVLGKRAIFIQFPTLHKCPKAEVDHLQDPSCKAESCDRIHHSRYLILRGTLAMFSSLRVRVNVEATGRCS